MQKTHIVIFPCFAGNISYFIVDKSVQAESLLLDSTLALINFIMCKPSSMFGSIFNNSSLFSLFCMTSAASE